MGKHWVLSTLKCRWRASRANATLQSCRHCIPPQISRAALTHGSAALQPLCIGHPCPGASPTWKHLQEERLFPHCTSCAGKMKIRNRIFTGCSADNRQALAKVWRLNSNFLTAQISSLFYPDFNLNTLNMLTTACVSQNTLTANF